MSLAVLALAALLMAAALGYVWVDRGRVADGATPGAGSGHARSIEADHGDLRR